MRITIIPEPTDWRLWFTWFPIMVEGDLVWLEFVERRRSVYGTQYRNRTDRKTASYAS